MLSENKFTRLHDCKAIPKNITAKGGVRTRPSNSAFVGHGNLSGEACFVSLKCDSTISFAIDSVLFQGSWYWWILDAATEPDGRMPSPIVDLAFQ